MPTKRTPINRARLAFDDYHAAEALTLRAALIPDLGFYDPLAPGVSCSQKRDIAAIAQAWATRERELLALWISGWVRHEKWVSAFTPGKPGTRPPGWWKHCAPERRRR